MMHVVSKLSEAATYEEFENFRALAREYINAVAKVLDAKGVDWATTREIVDTVLGGELNAEEKSR